MVRQPRGRGSQFGATELECHRRDDSAVVHAELRVGDSLVMLLATGAASESAPEDKVYGHRNAGVVDPNGITWWIGSPVA